MRCAGSTRGAGWPWFFVVSRVVFDHGPRPARSLRMPHSLPHPLSFYCGVLAAALFGSISTLAGAEAPTAEPLHVRIDRLIEKKPDFTPAPPAGDAEFLRRIYLDLIGRIPSVAQAKEFLADSSAD